LKIRPLEIENAAKLLGVSDATLRRWIEQGKIPARKQGSRYVLNRLELEGWARKRNISLIEPFKAQIKNDTGEHSLTKAMEVGGVLPRVAGKDVRRILETVALRMYMPEGIERAHILEQLLQREELVSTGIGNGVAIPHPRHPIPAIPQGGQITTCYLEEAVQFGAVDGKPVFILFVILSPDTAHHLKLLSRLSFCLRDIDFISELTKQPSPDELYARVREIETRLITSLKSQEGPRIG
jgi:nitrogen PTS system EIIA component